MNNSVEVTRNGHILEVNLNKPKVNAIDIPMSQALGEAFAELRDDPELRVGILTAEGQKIFSAGWDLKELSCDTCIDKPCMSACPAQAVLGIGQFDFNGCAGHRHQPGSGCADRCLSRLACPIAPEQRYPIEQVQYHYSLSLSAIREWANKNKA